MASLGDGRRSAAELAAYQALWNLWCSASRPTTGRENWTSACRMLETFYTVSRARSNREICEMRIHYLQIAEPTPRLADFVAPPNYGRVPDAERQLAQARHQYQLARRRHPIREQQRLKELETTKALYAAILAGEARAKAAAEIARRREWQRSRWPEDVVLEREIYELDGIAVQVERQNALIDSQVTALAGLLRTGLAHLRSAANSPVPVQDRDAANLAARVEAALTAMSLPRGINPVLTVDGSRPGRQVVIECELPTPNVVPGAKTYRYVKALDTVVATPRPAGQRKALYASIIAQIALLAVATVFELCGCESVTLHGVVTTPKPDSAQPMRACLISVRAQAETFAGLDLENTDPAVCLQRLSAAVSPNPAEGIPVRPLAH
jgi:restriction system protein